MVQTYYTILKRQSVAMPVVCSCCQSCRCQIYLQQKRKERHQRGQTRDKELTKSASVIDPAVLLTPTRHHHPMSTTRGTTSTRMRQYSSRCHRWEMSRRREPGLFMLSQNDRTRAYAVCALRSAHAARNRRCGHSIARARSCTRQPALKSQGAKADKKSHIAVAECATQCSLFSLFRISICVCGVSIFSQLSSYIGNIYILSNYKNTRKHRFPLQLTLIRSTCCVNFFFFFGR